MKSIWRKKEDFSHNEHSKGKVFVALSGGVDSAVALYLLKEKGYDVVGVFIFGWQPPFWECSASAERRDALYVCATLGVPFDTLHKEEEYKSLVVEPFIEAYKNGEVPNPDVLCNGVFKFGTFYDYAMSKGADFIATGHYAQSKDGTIKRAIDSKKDQSYFLWSVQKERLAKTLFPVGEFTKKEVRELAMKIGLHNAEKKDSQGICFLGSGGMRNFLSRYIKEKRGDVLDENGKVIGYHSGAQFYTLGQRQGLTLTNNNPEREPLFVVEKNIKNNILVVSNNPVPKTGYKVSLKNANWLVEDIPATAIVQSSYHGKTNKIKLKNESGITIEDTKPVEFYTRGQSVVFYNDEDVLLGGAVIEKVERM